MMVVSFLGTWVPILAGNFFSFSFNFFWVCIGLSLCVGYIVLLMLSKLYFSLLKIWCRFDIGP